ncbi:MAG: RluA family pseudouridine synthase [Acidobacteriaceae bacterium]|nr:RluA family pseudouridine synthase [Acidobacteriaceae bacterium]
MPSKNMLPKGKRRKSVKAEYRKVRTQVEDEKVRRAEENPFADMVAEDDAGAGEDYYDVDEMMEAAKAPVDPSNPYLIITNPIGTRNEIQSEDGRRYEGLKLLESDREAIPVLDELEAEDGVRSLKAPAVAEGMRLDAYLAKALPDVSRGRVQLLIENGQVQMDGVIAKAKTKLKGGEQIEIEGEPQLEPLRAEPENIPLRVVFEDDDLAVIDKPAAMTVHAGSGSVEHNRGTLVNALLYHFGEQALANSGDPVRPGIVHRLDKETSGLIVVAKNDSTHRKLSEMFATRDLRKVYLALAHGHLREDAGTVDLPISRDLHRRIRMTTKRPGGRTARTNYRVLKRFESEYGKFTFVELHIETGRTHQIRVHLQALGHPVVGDPTYGAPHALKPANPSLPVIEPERHFLHAAELDFVHPQTGEEMELRAELPVELTALLEELQG